MAELIKHSQRTVRKPCKHCGSKDLYWAHDNDNPGENYCTACGTDGRFVLINPDMTPHDCRNTPQAKDSDVGNRFDNKLAEENARKLAEAEAQDNGQAPQTSGVPVEALAAMQLLMETMGNGVNKDELQAMIKGELVNQVFPTVTIVEKVSGETKRIDGAHQMLGEIITDLQAGLHVMMVGPAGTGKSTLAESAAEALGLGFNSLSLSPMTPNSAILGYMDAAGNYVPSLFRDSYENGKVFLFDEIDNSHPSALAVVNAALANGQMAFPDGMVKRHENFRVLASANTYGRGADRQYVGRQQMDAATLDRFAVETVNVDEALEHSMCVSTGLETSQVEKVLRYCRKLRKSAEDQAMRVIISPRATKGMCALMANGKSWEAAAEAVVFKGLSPQDRAKLGA